MLSLQVSQLLQPPTLPETAAAASSEPTGIELRRRSMEGGVAWDNFFLGGAERWETYPLGKLLRFAIF